MRHAEAEQVRSTDAARQLTKRGRDQAQDSTEFIVEKTKNQSCLIVASPYIRAQETAQFIADRLNQPIHSTQGIRPDDPVSLALHTLNNIAHNEQNIIVVSHMNLIADLAQYLEYGHIQAPQAFYTAEVRQYDFLAWAAFGISQRASYVPR